MYVFRSFMDSFRLELGHATAAHIVLSHKRAVQKIGDQSLGFPSQRCHQNTTHGHTKQRHGLNQIQSSKPHNLRVLLHSSLVREPSLHFLDVQRTPDRFEGPVGGCLRPVVVQTLKGMIVVVEEGNDPSESFLIKAFCTVFTSLGFKLREVRRGEGFVRGVTCCMTLISYHQQNLLSSGWSVCTCVIKTSFPAH